MRINGITVNHPEPGRYFLVKVENYRHGGAEHYELSAVPGRTNQSHEEVFEGWLGSFNDVSRTASGAVEIYLDGAGRMRARRISAEALVAEDDNEI